MTHAPAWPLPTHHESDCRMRITDEHVDQWREHGYVLVENFLTPDELAAARANLALYLPTSDEYAATPQRYKGLNTFLEFPFAGDAMNDIATHPELDSFVQRVLGADDLFLTQSILWAKYAGAENFEQNLHSDWHGNSLLYPRDDGMFQQIPMIVYYSDVTEDDGPTRVVPRGLTEGEFLHPGERTRAERPDLYEQELKATAPAGSVLIWSMRTFHRGSEILAKQTARFSHFLVWRAAANNWMGYQAWPRDSHTFPDLERFIGRATPRQRELLGIPAPGHPYWNEETIAGNAARYPGFDATPYERALHEAQALPASA
jgi:hypothetical protein